MRRTTGCCRQAVLMTAREAVADIADGAVLSVGGFGYCGTAFTLLDALHQTRVRDITLISATVPGEDFGVGPLLSAGQLRKLVTSYMGENKVLAKLFHNGKVEVELSPMGTLTSRMTAGGSGVAALFVPTGYGTAVADGGIPERFDAEGSGRVVRYSAPRETRCVEGRWCCYETALHADYALIHAWKADRRGNLVFRGTARNFNAAAARCARVCIAEVEELVDCGELDPNHIHLPGIYVNRIVHVPGADKPIERRVTRDGTAEHADGGEGSTTAMAVDHDDAKHRIARRAALEVKSGMVLNIGIGIPTLVSMYVPAETDVMTMSGNGLIGIGPFPSASEVDADVVNASKQTVTVDRAHGGCFVDAAEAFGLMRGGFIDMSFMGTMEVAENGDLANWLVPGKRMTGMGGGMDLVSGGCKIIVLTTHVNADGSPKLLHRCRAPLTGHGVVDKIITDLAVFDVVRSPGGVRSLLLTEVAEGVSLDQLHKQTEASFAVAPQLRTMQQAPVPVH